MKVTVQRFKEGLLKYVDKEFASKFSDFRKWIIPFAGAGLVNAYVDPILEQYSEFAIAMGYMTEDGLIEVDNVFDKLFEIAKQQGEVVQYIPMLKDVTFTCNDIKTIRSLM